ncbi:hypothetical protein [Alteromonas sp. H39]|uniref:hypothetical protein n=1 Tax=Alteromonas sp. H39 TaxID=3389876 RepID=UPI0039E0BB72
MMKKIAKIAVFSVIGLLSVSISAKPMTSQGTTSFVDEACSLAPLICSVTTLGNGSGDTPPLPDPKRPKDKEK